MKRKAFIALCVIPAAVLFTVFMLLPTLNVFRLSLYRQGAFDKTATYVGFANFEKLLRDEAFIRSMQNTLLLIVVITVITLSLALVFASILTREKLKGQSFFRAVFYIPNILSIVVISGIFSAVYKTEDGLLNSLVNVFTTLKSNIQWKGEDTVMLSVMIALVWQALGYYMVMYMASMAAVPQSLYECSGLDGANRRIQFFQITLPMIWTNIRTTLTFFIISTINMAFLLVKAMTDGGPNGASNVVLLYMYDQKNNGVYGYCMAIGVVIFLVSFALSALVNRVTQREPLEY